MWVSAFGLQPFSVSPFLLASMSRRFSAKVSTWALASISSSVSTSFSAYAFSSMSSRLSISASTLTPPSVLSSVFASAYARISPSLSTSLLLFYSILCRPHFDKCRHRSLGLNSNEFVTKWLILLLVACQPLCRLVPWPPHPRVCRPVPGHLHCLDLRLC